MTGDLLCQSCCIRYVAGKAQTLATVSKVTHPLAHSLNVSMHAAAAVVIDVIETLRGVDSCVALGLRPRDVSRQIFGTTWQDLLMLNRNMCVQ